jgi:hypothetical protein
MDAIATAFSVVSPNSSLNNRGAALLFITISTPKQQAYWIKRSHVLKIAHAFLKRF